MKFRFSLAILSASLAALMNFQSLEHCGAMASNDWK